MKNVLYITDKDGKIVTDHIIFGEEKGTPISSIARNRAQKHLKGLKSIPFLEEFKDIELDLNCQLHIGLVKTDGSKIHLKTLKLIRTMRLKAVLETVKDFLTEVKPKAVAKIVAKKAAPKKAAPKKAAPKKGK